MPLGSHPDPFDQAPIDVSGFTSGPVSLQRSRKEGSKEGGGSWDHTLLPDPPSDTDESRQQRLISLLLSHGWQQVAGDQQGGRSSSVAPCRRVGAWKSRSPPFSSLLLTCLRVIEHRRWIKIGQFHLCSQKCAGLYLTLWLDRTDLLFTSFKTRWWLSCQKSSELSAPCIMWVCSCGPAAQIQVLKSF